MGSSGSSTLGDYSRSAKKDKCDESIDTDLEDVAHSQYYKKRKTVPPKGTPVQLRVTLLSGRLVVDETKTGLAIGNLPTGYNYLVLCMKNGRDYTGSVTVSQATK